LGALIAFRLATNREKGGVCGDLIASRLLALHGVVPHDLDIQFPIERLDLIYMIQHKFVSSEAWLGNLSYEITFFKKSAWRVVKSDRLVHLPAPLLFNLDGRNGWSLTEDELDAYMKEDPQHVTRMDRGLKIILSSLPALGSSHTNSPILIMDLLLHLHESQITIMPMMTHQPGAITGVGIDLHLGQKPKLGGRYADDSLIYTSYFVGTLYIHVSLSFSLLFLFLFLLSKTQKDQKYFRCFSLLPL
jgi:hypothetical protein